MNKVKAGQVMQDAAALLNDAARTNFTNENMLPYLNMAIRELREFCQQNNVAITNVTTDEYVIEAGVKDIGGPTGPALPQDLIEIRQILERQDGTEFDFVPMVRTEFLPPTQVQTAWLTWWAWNNQYIQFIGATGDQQLRIEYISEGIPEINSPDQYIKMINAQSFLQYRTAALVSHFVGENESRAEALNQTAQLAADRFIQTNVKGKQAIATRRRPFMMSYKVNSNYGV